MYKAKRPSARSLVIKSLVLILEGGRRPSELSVLVLVVLSLLVQPVADESSGRSLVQDRSNRIPVVQRLVPHHRLPHSRQFVFDVMLRVKYQII